MGKNAPRKTSPKGNREIQKAIETRNGTIVTEEKSSNGENKEPKKEVALSDQSEKYFASLIHTNLGVEVVKEGGNQEKSKEESNTEEE